MYITQHRDKCRLNFPDLSKGDFNLNGRGVVVDFGTSNIKAMVVDRDGCPIKDILGKNAIWRVTTGNSLTANGEIILAKFKLRFTKLLSSIFNSGIKFDKLEFIAAVSIAPTTVITGVEGSLTKKGFSYNSNVGKRSYLVWRNNKEWEKLRGIPATPQNSWEILEELTRRGVKWNNNVKVWSLGSYLLFQLSAKGRWTMPGHMFQYMGLAGIKGNVIYPSGLNHNNFWPIVSEKTSFAGGTAEWRKLVKIGCKANKNHKVKLIDLGMDGTIFHQYLELYKNRTGADGARAKYESTVVFSANTDKKMIEGPIEGWLLKIGDCQAIGKSSQGVDSLRKLTWQLGFNQVNGWNIKNSQRYLKMFNRADDEVEDSYFAKLDEELMATMINRKKYFARNLKKAGIMIFGRDRNGAGPDRASILGGEFPSDPVVYYYLLKESTVFALKRGIDWVETVTGRHYDLIGVGPINISEIWRMLNQMITGKPICRINFEGQLLLEPSLLAMVIKIFKLKRNYDKLNNLVKKLDFVRILDKKGLKINEEILDNRYKVYCGAFGESKMLHKNGAMLPEGGNTAMSLGRGETIKSAFS